jgi:transposase InsO family protein
MDRVLKQRLTWVQLYEKSKDADFVFRRCWISRPTLRKWWYRYRSRGLEGLEGLSKRPRSSPCKKVLQEQTDWILELRSKSKLGARRIQSELLRQHNFRLSLATIHKVLKRSSAKPLVRLKRKEHPHRYARPIPGDRVQMDTCKIRKGIYQYTAVDDCTRFKVMALYPKRTAENTLRFLEKVVEEMPFPIQRIQTDRGLEFFALKVQKRLMERGIKFRPVRPASPHLNGKVERAQKTDLDEFYSTVNLDAPDLEEQLDLWQFFYNWHRPHGGLNGKTPIDRGCELFPQTPLSEEVDTFYDPSKERMRVADYGMDMRLAKLKRSL